jgi:hypothetical protein
VIFVIALAAVGLAGGLAMRSGIPPWVPLLVPVALAILGDVLWHGEVEENRDLLRAEIIIIEILTLVSLIGGFAYRWHRARRGAAP